MRRLVCGDIHGRLDALKQVLSLSNFDYDNDKLILLGDIADGGYQVAQVVDELLKIKNIVFVIGNHDVWFMNGISSGWAENIWLCQGGENTLKSYGINVNHIKDQYIDINIPVTHQEFFNNGKYYHIEDNMIFVHGGFNPKIPINKNKPFELTWDRDLWHYAQRHVVEPYDKVFIGHTTTQTFYNNTIPLKFNNLWMLDTGAGWTGKLTIMDIDTEQYWQSDIQNPAR